MLLLIQNLARDCCKACVRSGLWAARDKRTGRIGKSIVGRLVEEILMKPQANEDPMDLWNLTALRHFFSFEPVLWLQS